MHDSPAAVCSKPCIDCDWMLFFSFQFRQWWLLTGVPVKGGKKCHLTLSLALFPKAVMFVRIIRFGGHHFSTPFLLVLILIKK